MGNAYNKQSHIVTNNEIQTLIGFFAEVKHVSPPPDYYHGTITESPYGNVSVLIYDSEQKNRILYTINSYYLHVNNYGDNKISGKIEEICIEKERENRTMCCNKWIFKLNIKFENDEGRRVYLGTQEFRIFIGDKTRIIEECRPSESYDNDVDW